MTWEKLPPLTDDKIHVGCANCSTAAKVAPMGMCVNVGFGSSSVTKDGKTVWREDDDSGFLEVQDVEEMAAADSDHDWRITRLTPLHGETFQRHGPEMWICVESHPGFA